MPHLTWKKHRADSWDLGPIQKQASAFRRYMDHLYEPSSERCSETRTWSPAFRGILHAIVNMKKKTNNKVLTNMKVAKKDHGEA
jgi:hypothetical protein